MHKLFLCLAACFLIKAARTQTIDGTFKENKGLNIIYLHQYPDIGGTDHMRMKIDSAVIVDGHFHFNFVPGKEPGLSKLLHPRNWRDRKDSIYYEETSIFLANDSIVLLINDSLSGVRVFNSPINYDYAILKEMVGPINSRMRDLEDQITLEYLKTVPKQFSQTKEFQKYNVRRKRLIEDERSAIYEKFIRDNPYSWVSLYALNKRLVNGDGWKVSPGFERLYNGMSKKLKQSELGTKIGRSVAAKAKLRIGATAPGFQLPDTSGKLVRLADYRGKYVLLEFWSSGCGGCRAESPHLKAAFEKYHAKGFNILSVSLNDERINYYGKDAWIRAIREDGTGKWRQVSDLKGWKSPVATLYDIRSIPQNYLIDPNGIIISENLRGADLYDKLEDMFGQ
jgi:thiol-disulfide isomerase/thioredoxin